MIEKRTRPTKRFSYSKLRDHYRASQEQIIKITSESDFPFFEEGTIIITSKFYLEKCLDSERKEIKKEKKTKNKTQNYSGFEPNQKEMVGVVETD